MKEVFISFSSKESDIAEQTCSFLEKNNISCFISSRDLIAGQEYAEQLVDNIAAAKVVLLMLSKASNDSPHVLREVEYAVSHKIPILVYSLEDVELSKSMEYFLMTHQWIISDENKEKHLLEGVEKFTERAKTGAGSRKTGDNRADSSKEDNKKLARTLIIRKIAVGVLGIAIACILIAIIVKKYKTNNTELEEQTVKEIDYSSVYKVGDSVFLGTFYDEPIEWRVIKINDDSTMVLLSKYILTVKAYDAAESGKTNVYEDVSYLGVDSKDIDDDKVLVQLRGNNDWSLCNLRTWLNSDAEKINYTDQEPTPNAVTGNYYSEEPGFLHDFTQAEKDALVVVTNASPANSLSRNADDGYVYSDDLVYILSYDELGMVIDAEMSVYAKPTAACMAHDEFEGTYIEHINYSNTDNYSWWLRDNDGSFPNWTYVIYSEYETKEVSYGKYELPVGSNPSFSSSFGVRPAVTVDIKKMTELP